MSSARLEETMERLKSPQFGDVFTEQFSVYLYVTDVSKFGVISIFRFNSGAHSNLLYKYHKLEDFCKDNSYDTNSSGSPYFFLKNISKNETKSTIINEFSDLVYDDVIVARICQPNYDFLLKENGEEAEYSCEQYVLKYDSSGLTAVKKNKS